MERICRVAGGDKLEASSILREQYKNATIDCKRDLATTASDNSKCPKPLLDERRHGHFHHPRWQVYILHCLIPIQFQCGHPHPPQPVSNRHESIMDHITSEEQQHHLCRQRSAVGRSAVVRRQLKRVFGKLSRPNQLRRKRSRIGWRLVDGPS
jgi:hypothetical protein